MQYISFLCLIAFSKNRPLVQSGLSELPTLLLCLDFTSCLLLRSVDGRYNPMGKLGCAVLAQHSAKDVS